MVNQTSTLAKHSHTQFVQICKKIYIHQLCEILSQFLEINVCLWYLYLRPCKDKTTLFFTNCNYSVITIIIIVITAYCYLLVVYVAYN